MSKSTRTKKQTTDITSQSVSGRLKSLPQKHLLLASVLLHLVFFSLLFINWQNQEPIKPIHIPKNISAHVVSADQVKVLQDKKNAEKIAQEKKVLDEKIKAEEKKKLLQQKALEKKQAKEAALKKSEELKKKAKEERLKLKKEKEKEQKDKLEQEKRDQEKKAQRKREEEKKRKQAEQEKQKLEEERIAKEQKQKIKEQEDKLLEKLQNLEQKKRLAEQVAAENLKAEQAFLEYEASEVDRYKQGIKTKIVRQFIKPPKSEGLVVILQIKLLPNGELLSVKIKQSSGSSAFDRAATLAVKSVRNFPLPKDSKVFENNFRQFSMAFTDGT